MNKNTPTTTNRAAKFVAALLMVATLIGGPAAQTFTRPTGTRPTATTTEEN